MVYDLHLLKCFGSTVQEQTLEVFKNPNDTQTNQMFALFKLYLHMLASSYTTSSGCQKACHILRI